MGLETVVRKMIDLLQQDIDESEVTDRTNVVNQIVQKNEEKRIVMGAVLVPDEKDHSGDTVTKEKIEELAHTYLQDYRNVDKQHQLANKGKVVESYITPVELCYKQEDEEIVIPAGSWLMSVKVKDDETWKEVKAGKLNGFSIMAVNKEQQSNKNKTDSAIKGFNIVNLADLADDYEVNYVSLVDAPDVPKARFATIKSQEGGVEMQEEEIQEVVKATIKELDLSAVIKEEVEQVLADKEDELEQEEQEEEKVEEIQSETEEESEQEEIATKEDNQIIKQLITKIEELQQAVAPKSKSIIGQDDVVAKQVTTKSINQKLGRDNFGRKTINERDDK